MAISFSFKRKKASKDKSPAPPKDAASLAPPERPPTDTGEAKPKRKFKLSKTKTPKTKRTKLSFAKKTAFVLLIGDDGAILIFLQKGVVEGRWFAPEVKEEHFELFNRAIHDHPAVPFLVFLDTLDQTYLQQSLPPVNKMGLGAIMKRRLKREFGGVEIKGARLLGKEKDKKEWLFQMISADTTETVKSWLAWITTTPNRCMGVRLLPLEMESVVKAMYQKTNPTPEGEPHSWLYLLSHQKVSGFRQVILRDGKMIFTRVGQTLHGVSDVIAGLVEQEIMSTVEYLKRLGLRDAAHIHLHVIASQDVLQVIDPVRAGIHAFATLTPHQAAEMMELVNATQPTDRYGDMVTASAAARLSKPTFNTLTSPLQQLAKLHQMVAAVKVVPLLLVAALILGSLSAAYGAWTAYEKKSEYVRKKQIITQELSEVQTEMSTVEDIEKVKDVLDVLRAVEQKELAPDTFMLKLSAAKDKLGPQFTINGVDWKTEDHMNQKNKPEEKNQPTGPETKIEVMVSFIYAADINQSPEDILKGLNASVDTIRPLFEGYKITIENLPEMKVDALTLGGATPEGKQARKDIGANLKFVGAEKAKASTLAQASP